MRIQELGHVVLYVTDIDRSASFYREALGFPEILRNDQIALFSGGRIHHELLLIGVGGRPAERRDGEPGLYHIGFKIGDRPEQLREAHRELKAKNVAIVGATDHGITHSLYLLDPDGNELELYVDVSDAWKRDPKAIIAPPRLLNLE